MRYEKGSKFRCLSCERDLEVTSEIRVPKHMTMVRNIGNPRNPITHTRCPASGLTLEGEASSPGRRKKTSKDAPSKASKPQISMPVIDHITRREKV